MTNAENCSPRVIIIIVVKYYLKEREKKKVKEMSEREREKHFSCLRLLITGKVIHNDTAIFCAQESLQSFLLVGVDEITKYKKRERKKKKQR